MSDLNSKDKLILISPMLHQGGFERVCVTTARLLEPYYDITIVIFDDKDIAYDISGLNIINLNLGVREGRVAKIATMFKRAAALKKIKKNMKPVAAYSFGTTANLVNSLSGVPGVENWIGLRSYMDMLEPSKIKLFIRHADLIVCCSRVIEDELNGKYSFNKTVTLYNPYNVESILEDAKKELPEPLPWEKEGQNTKTGMLTLAAMGREDDVKGFWHCIKAFKEVHDRIDDSALMFIGDGDFSKYKKLAEELGVADRVYFAGLRKNPYQYLSKCEIYLLTSENEGFPNALVEGMICSLAAIATDCMTGPREILDNGRYGILIPDFTHGINLNADDITDEDKALADRILGLAQNRDELIRYQELSKERGADFSYERYINSMRSMVREAKLRQSYE